MDKLNAILINLTAASQRWDSVKDSFRLSNFSSNFTLTRLNAINSNYIAEHNIIGTCSSVEKACFLSHVEAFTSIISADGHAFILEDDVLFCHQTEELLNSVLSSIHEECWDIIFTDLIVEDPFDMFRLHDYMQGFDAEKKIFLFDARKARLTGATAYVINKKAKDKIMNIYRKVNNIDVPFDIFLMDKVNSGEINAFFTFPFLTSLSDSSFSSQIQGDNMSYFRDCWNAFRRLMWVGANLADIDAIVPAGQWAVPNIRLNAMLKIVPLLFYAHYRYAPDKYSLLQHDIQCAVKPNVDSPTPSDLSSPSREL
jgi:GR25 family glycosyltransferase involved in LPS biosynthesis